MKKYPLVLLSLSLLLSEIILKINSTAGFVFYCALITGCVIALSKAESLDNQGKLMIVFMILPTIRIADLVIGFDFLLRSFIVYNILLFLVIFYCVKLEINPGYTKKKIALLPIMILIGIVFGLFWNNFFFTEKWIGYLFMLPVIVYAEEVLFRGMIQNLIGREYNGVSAVFFTSLLYWIFSLSYGLAISLFFFAVSLVLCLIYQRTKNIYLTMALSFVVQLFVLVLA